MTTHTTSAHAECKGSSGRASCEIVPAGGAAMESRTGEAERWMFSP